MGLGEESLESLISFTNVSNVFLKAVRQSLNLFSCVGHAVIQAEFIRVSVVTEVFLKSSENFLMLLLLAESDLLHIGKVITDMLWLIAVGLHALEVGHLHSLHCWRDIVGEFSDCVNRLFSERLAGHVGVVDGLQVLGIFVEKVRDHGLRSMLWKIKATFRHFLIYI